MRKAYNRFDVLVVLMKKGDQSAFQEVFHFYQQSVYRFIFSLTKSNLATEDILQEVFVKIWMVRKTIDCSKSFDSYLFTIAKNLSLNYLKKVSNQRTLREELWRNLTHINTETEDRLLSKEYEAIVNDILENIPQRKRSIFILSKQQGKSNQEIAELLGISKKTVKNHLWKTLQTVRTQLKPHLADTMLPIGYLLLSLQ